MRFAASVVIALGAASAFAAPPYQLSVIGVRDAGFASPSPALMLERRYPGGGAIVAGEPALDVKLYPPAGGEVLALPNQQFGQPTAVLRFNDGSATTDPFHLRLLGFNVETVVVDGGSNVVPPFQFDMTVYLLSHRLTFDTSEDFLANYDFHYSSVIDSRASIGYAAYAAHEGDAGYFFKFDPPALSGSGFAASVQRFYTPFAGNMYIRTWARLRSHNNQGAVNLFNVHAFGPTTSPIADYGIDLPDGRPYASGHDRNATYFRDAGSVYAADGGWFLAELWLEGIDTPNGFMKAWVNGQLSSVVGPVDWTGYRVKDLEFGVPWLNDKLFVGEIVFDELAVTPVEPPTFLRALGPSNLPVGACQPYQLVLTSADGTTASAYRTHDLGVQIFGSASASMFADSNCTVPLSGPLRIQPGVSIFSFFIRASSAGTLTLNGNTRDLISTDWVFNTVAAADAGTDAGTTADGGADAGAVDGGSSSDAGDDAGSSTQDGGDDAGSTAVSDGGLESNDGGDPVNRQNIYEFRQDLGVGCGCQGAPGAVAMVALLLAASLRRRQRR